MRIAILSSIMFALPALVAACEGDCIVDITNAFISNYTTPVNTLFKQLANEMVVKVLPNRRYASPPISLMRPLLDAYHKSVYATLEHAIFPSYFHGKCQQPDPKNPDGPRLNPPGCPNPDCPIVCGTPGSMVHFYPKLRWIAFSSTRRQLVELASPGSDAYRALEENVMAEIESGSWHKKRAAGTRMPKQRKGQKARGQVREIMNQISSRLEQICGGTGTGTTNGLPKCSWEKQMKEFILTYP